MPFVRHVLWFINEYIRQRTLSHNRRFYVFFAAGCVCVMGPRDWRTKADEQATFTKPNQFDLIFLLFMVFKRNGRSSSIPMHSVVFVAELNAIRHCIRFGLATLNVKVISWRISHVEECAENILTGRFIEIGCHHSHTSIEVRSKGGKPGSFFTHICPQRYFTRTAHFLFRAQHRQPSKFHDNNLWYGVLRSDGENRNGLFHLDSRTLLAFDLPKLPAREIFFSLKWTSKKLRFFHSHLLYTLIIM